MLTIATRSSALKPSRTADAKIQSSSDASSWVPAVSIRRSAVEASMPKRSHTMRRIVSSSSGATLRSLCAISSNSAATASWRRSNGAPTVSAVGGGGSLRRERILASIALPYRQRFGSVAQEWRAHWPPARDQHVDHHRQCGQERHRHQHIDHEHEGEEQSHVGLELELGE